MRNEEGWTSEPMTITDYTNPPIFRGGLGDPIQETPYEPVPVVTPTIVRLGWEDKDVQ